MRGYKEEGTTTTPFDMVMLNDLDRFHLVMDVIDRVPGLGERAAGLRQQMADERLRHRAYTREHGDDPPDVRDWTWPGGAPARDGARRAACRADGGVRVLVANAGSSSLKLSLLDADDSELWASELEAPRAVIEADAVAAALAELPAAPDAAGHRIVHGGERFRDAVVVDDEVLGGAARADRARAASPAEVAGCARRRAAALPDVPAVACFDTAFHATLPPAAATYALPRAWRERYGLRRYGFHGLSHAYAARAARRTRAGSSPATSAPAPRCAQCSTAARSTPRWASPRSRGW